MSSFQLTELAVEDLDQIWWFIAADNSAAADRVEAEILHACRRLAKHPLIGSIRRDITELPVRFWNVTAFQNYAIVYRPEVKPIVIIAILHSKQNWKNRLKERAI